MIFGGVKLEAGQTQFYEVAPILAHIAELPFNISAQHSDEQQELL